MHTLLLADDSVTTQRIVALSFAEESFRVVSVSDGQQAIDSMAVRCPDIVLAATALPRTNGYELAEYMRGVELLRDVPVLLLSGAFESVDTARLEASGARGIIEKPLEPTAMISRVRELLGLKDPGPTPLAGRLVTFADTPADRKAAPRVAAALPAAGQPSVSSWDELGQESGRASGAPDPRSPGRRPSPTSGGAPTNAVFEVDSDWFSDEHKVRDTDSRNEIVTDAHAAMPPRPDVPANPIYEVDDEWFAEDEKAHEARRALLRNLAAEMGIHDLELPEAEPVPNVPAPLGPAVTGPPPVAKPEVAPLAAEITEAMLDQIAQRVADRLNSGAFGAQLRDAVTATVRDTVRSVVSDTSERLVRDEIARIKSKTQT